MSEAELDFDARDDQGFSEGYTQINTVFVSLQMKKYRYINISNHFEYLTSNMSGTWGGQSASRGGHPSHSSDSAPGLHITLSLFIK